MKLEEGMYVRYIPTIGEYTQKISKITKTKNCLLDMCYTLDDKEEVFSSHFEDILGASHNIIDLIEVGDYVNGEKITRVIPQDICGDEVLDCQHIFVNDKEIFKHEINSIVTKELFENIKYEVNK